MFKDQGVLSVQLAYSPPASRLPPLPAAAELAASSSRPISLGKKNDITVLSEKGLDIAGPWGAWRLRNQLSVSHCIEPYHAQ